MSEISAIDKHKKHCDFVDANGPCKEEAVSTFQLDHEAMQIWNGHYCEEHVSHVAASIQSHHRLLSELQRPVTIIDVGQLSDMPNGVDTTKR